MLSWFTSAPDEGSTRDPARATAILPVPLEQSEPATQASWRDHVGGALTTTWKTGTDIAVGAADVAGRAVQGVGDAAGFVGRYGVDSAGSALTVAGHAVSGIGRVGGNVIDLAVVSPASLATRSAATLADATIVKPARAISRFVLIALGIVCSSCVAIAGFAALTMYFYHGGHTQQFAPAPTIVVLPPGASVVGTPVQTISQQGQLKAAQPQQASAGE